MSRREVREIQHVVSEHTAKREHQNGDTRSPISPGGRDGFGSGGGPTQVIPLQVYTAFVKQHNYLSYLVNCQDLWDQADTQVVRGGHTGKRERESDRECGMIGNY